MQHIGQLLSQELVPPLRKLLFRLARDRLVASGQFLQQPANRLAMGGPPAESVFGPAQSRDGDDRVVMRAQGIL